MWLTLYFYWSVLFRTSTTSSSPPTGFRVFCRELWTGLPSGHKPLLGELEKKHLFFETVPPTVKKWWSQHIAGRLYCHHGRFV